MKDIIPATKQSPILGLTGLGGGVGSNIVAGGAADSTYVDDVFSTYLWKGTGSDQSFNNGIKLGNSNAGSGVEFGGSGDYLQIEASDDLNLTDEFTIEAWVKVDDGGWSGTRRTLLANSTGWATNHAAVSLMNSASSNEENTIILYNNTSTIADSSPVRIEPSDGWTHIAIARDSGNDIRIFKNGIQVGSTATYSGDFKFGLGETWIGAITMSTGATPETYDGKISNLRVIKGTALYTSNFTPPTAELASITNTKLLCCNTPVMTTATVTPNDITVYGNTHPSGGPFTAIDGEGGMVWMKVRNSSTDFVLMDTERGIDKLMFTNGTWNQEAAAANDKANTFRSFDNNGFTIGNTGYVNTSGQEYTSWTWRKQKGFFDIVPYSGDSTTRDIAHNLGCIPGVIILKRLDADGGWQVYHRDLPNTSNAAWAKILRFDTDNAQQVAYCLGSSSTHTSSTFRVGNDNSMNTSGGSYVAYLFAGGESTAATARSIDLDGSEGIDVAASSALNLGTSNFCIEGWIYVDDAPGSGTPSFGRFFQLDGPTINSAATNLQITINPNFTIYVQQGPDQLISGVKPLRYKWNHIALTRIGSTLTVYVNGASDGKATVATNYNPNSGSPRVRLGYADNTSSNNGIFNGKISNFRMTIGEGVYTSGFKVPTAPLTTTSQGVTASNVKLLCCNGSTTTSSTVTPATITAAGSPTAIVDSPFDDPDGFKFGEEGNQNIIKTGSYIGNGDTSNGTQVHLGFEPQWVLIKSATFNEHWHCFDSMRGMTNKVNNGVRGEDARLETNQSNQSETTSVDFIDVNSDGFTAYFANNVNANNETFVYIAVRRPDGHVAKPTKSGTDVFTQAYGLNTGDFRFTSGFPIDFAWAKIYDGGGNWWTSARLIQGGELKTDADDSEGGGSNKIFDNQFSWHASVGSANAYISHMWKRGAGFDVVAYKGNSVSGNEIPHNLGKTPEMMWVKRRNSSSTNWYVYHKDLSGGSNPETKYLNLNSSTSEAASTAIWNDTAPTSTHFTLGNNSDVNTSSGRYLAMLFASVDGVSKLGRYTGSTSDVTINLGFKPRLIIIKSYNQSSQRWTVFDSLRGMGVGSIDKRMYLDSDNQQQQGDYITSISATGITMKTNYSYTNSDGFEYLYYAHA